MWIAWLKALLSCPIYNFIFTNWYANEAVCDFIPIYQLYYYILSLMNSIAPLQNLSCSIIKAILPRASDFHIVYIMHVQ